MCASVIETKCHEKEHEYTKLIFSMTFFYLFLRASHGVANRPSTLKYSIRCLEHALIWSLKKGWLLVECVVIIRQDTLGYDLQE